MDVENYVKYNNMYLFIVTVTVTIDIFCLLHLEQGYNFINRDNC